MDVPWASPSRHPQAPCWRFFWSGRRDLNPRPQRPEDPRGSRAHVLGLIPLVSTVERVRPDEVERLWVCHVCAMASWRLDQARLLTEGWGRPTRPNAPRAARRRA